MPEAEIAKAVQLLDLMLEFFADDSHWARGCYDDGNGGHCLVGALLHLSRKHRLPTAPTARPWHLHGDARHHTLHQGQDLLCGGQADADVRALLDGCWRA